MNTRFLLLLVLLFSCRHHEPQEDTHILKAALFTMETPKTWTIRFGYGTFSMEMGYIRIDSKDSVVFHETMFSGSLTETDSVLIRENKIPAFDLKAGVDAVDIDRYRKQNISWDSIDGFEAKILFPRRPGSGMTGVYFDKTPAGKNKLLLYGYNLSPANEQLVLKAIRTIKFN